MFRLLPDMRSYNSHSRQPARESMRVQQPSLTKHLQSKRQLQLGSLTLGRNRRIGSARKTFLKMEFDLRMVHRRDQRVGKEIGRYVLMPSV